MAPGNIPDAAQYGRGKGLDSRDKTHEKVDLLEHDGVKDAGCSGGHSSDDEGGDDHLINVNPH